MSIDCLSVKKNYLDPLHEAYVDIYFFLVSSCIRGTDLFENLILHLFDLIEV